MYHIILNGIRRIFSGVTFNTASVVVPLDTKKQMPLTIRQEILATIGEIDNSAFSNYQPSSGMSFILEPAFKTIGEYTNVLIDLTQYLSKGGVVRADYFPSSVAFTISLDQFFTSRDGFYEHAQEVVLRFCNVAEYFCQVLEPIDTATAGLWEHNRRMLMKLLANVLEILKILADISLTSGIS